jgi:putative DNA primase/helicase
MPPDHIQEILSRLQSVRAVGANQWESLCPAHEDGRRSLSIGMGKNNRALVNCHAGCSTADVLKNIKLPLNALFQPREDNPFKQLGPIVATYDYVDENGELLFQVTRHNPKDFRQRRPNNTGGWIGSIDGVRKVVYRLPEVLAADAGDWVFVVEGEKDADNIRKLGLVGTCNPGGASKGKSKWLPEFNASFAGKRVCVIRDRDDVGIVHAQHVAAGIHGHAAEVRGPIDPPGSAKDISDWIEATSPPADDLREIAEAAPVFDPAAEPATATPDEPSSTGSLGERDQSGNLILSPKRTMPTARAFVREFYTHPDGPTLTTYSQMPFIWRNNRHEPGEWAMIEAELFPWLHEASRYIQNPQTKELEIAPFDANPSTVKAAQQTVSAFTIAANNVAPPIWKKKQSGDPPADELLVCRSNSIHLPTGKIIPPTPRLFVTASLDFDYDADAPTPDKWLAFLDQVFPGDAESVCLLQQWFGYCLTQDTRQQKILAMIGQKRSGKGTIGRVLKSLVGDGNVAGPTISSLSTQFGLQSLIGKTLAIIPDARFGGEQIHAVIERLLSISGEDALSIDRKFLPAVTMKLNTRLMILTNNIPALTDASGALASRFLVLRFNQTFYGRENLDLQKQLNAELPGILLWAIEGWHSLRAMGRFFEPKASKEIVEEMEDSMSPISNFVRDCCDVGNGSCWPADLYAAWRQWCAEQGRDRPGTVQSFGRDLRASVVGLSMRQYTDGRRFYDGIKLK